MNQDPSADRVQSCAWKTMSRSSPLRSTAYGWPAWCHNTNFLRRKDEAGPVTAAWMGLAVLLQP
jgi:hypothetical protein